MSFIQVCAIDPGPGAACPLDQVAYVSNLWDSGLTLAQHGELIGAVLGIWTVAYVVVLCRRHLF